MVASLGQAVEIALCVLLASTKKYPEIQRVFHARSAIIQQLWRLLHAQHACPVHPTAIRERQAPS